MLECPDCNRHFRGSECPNCGWQRPDARPRQPGERPRWDQQCQYNRDSARRCRLTPTVQETGGPQLCGWHDATRRDPRMASDFDAFEAFCLDLLERRYCTLWTHYPASYLWRCLQGEEPGPRPPLPCAQGGCLYRTSEASTDRPKGILERIRAVVLTATGAEKRP